MLFCPLFAEVKLGIDTLFENYEVLKGKNVGLITNHTAINSRFELTLDIFKKHSKEFKLVAVFAPEHGLYGDHYADNLVADAELEGIPLYSLHGKTKRPTAQMLDAIDVLVYDIQDIGCRSYTYISTLFYCMEEAAKKNIKVIVLDRPNPLGGYIVDGPLLEEKWRSFLGYVNVPYCHGMTVGELARFFNEEYKIGADLLVIAMKGWKREMTFEKTGLRWMPTSPQIPEGDTPFFYPTTGLIGQLSLTSIGIGYTLPFKVVGAPWLDAEKFTAKLNELKLPGVTFTPFYFRPFFGKFKSQECQGIKIFVTDAKAFLPVTTQYSILGVIKALYPKQFKEALDDLMKVDSKKESFNKLNGSEEILRIISQENYFIWKIRERFQKEKEKFLPIRRKYLNPSYS